jgi:hypothetical protein
MFLPSCLPCRVLCVCHCMQCVSLPLCTCLPACVLWCSPLSDACVTAPVCLPLHLRVCVLPTGNVLYILEELQDAVVAEDCLDIISWLEHNSPMLSTYKTGNTQVGSRADVVCRRMRHGVCSWGVLGCFFVLSIALCTAHVSYQYHYVSFYRPLLAKQLMPLLLRNVLAVPTVLIHWLCLCCCMLLPAPAVDTTLQCHPQAPRQA